MLWGSDCLLSIWRAVCKWLAAAETLLADLSPDEQADIFGGNRGGHLSLKPETTTC